MISKKIKGFTLVELLVVVAIIGILATIVAMNLQGAQNKARATATADTLNSTGKAISICLAGELTLSTPALGGNICSSTTLTDAKYWAAAVFNKYTLTLPTIDTVTNTVTAVPTAVNAAMPTVTCTASSSSYYCK